MHAHIILLFLVLLTFGILRGYCRMEDLRRP